MRHILATAVLSNSNLTYGQGKGNLYTVDRGVRLSDVWQYSLLANTTKMN